MAFAPQRFIHAANVRLDVPVSVHLTEQLTDELRHCLEDATLTAFDCIVSNCVSHKVDFLLLSGNVFVEADRSLRARLTLIRGCERLQQEQIPVFVLPGDADPQEAWRAIPDLPANVRVCFNSNPEPSTLRAQWSSSDYGHFINVVWTDRFFWHSGHWHQRRWSGTIPNWHRQPDSL